MVDAALTVGRTRKESPLAIEPVRLSVTPSTVVGQLDTVTAPEPSG